MSGMENALMVGIGVAASNSLLSMYAVKDEKVKYKVIKSVAHFCSWIPVLGAVVGIARIVFGAKQAHQLPRVGDNLKLAWKARSATNITRGSLEVLTLGSIAPLFILIDCIVMLSGAIFILILRAR